MNDKIPIGVVSLGCSKNRVDTELLLGVLRDDGFIFTPDVDKAQIIVINTCAFIQSAKEESIDTILEFTERKKQNPTLKIIVTGCLPERYRKELSKEIPEVDGWIGVNQYGMIAQIARAVYEGSHQEEYDAISSPTMPRVLTTQSHMAYVRIAEGCDHRCSYCVIPAIRGRYKSRKMEDILLECRWLFEQGVSEIVLIAQDTSYYGRDLYGAFRLPELLEGISTIGIPWVRLMYTYPERIDDRLLNVIESNPNLLPYLDMPLQHVNSTILKKMGRPMTHEGVEALLERIRKISKNFTLRTTFITGFPGESEEQFEELRAFVSQGWFDHVGVFAYSREEGTPAAAMDGQLDDAVKEKRAQTLMRTQRSVSLKANRNRIGQIANVIIETIDEDGRGCGRTFWQAPEVDGIVRVEHCDLSLAGKLLQCRILSADAYDLEGELLV